MIALPQLKLTLLRPQRGKKRNNIMTLKKTFLRVLVISVINKIIILGIALSQKISYSLGDFHVNDC